jgi:putative acyl-CoA dehydrogenase
MLGSAGLMRMALAQALHHCRHRRAFGQRLVDQPLMRTVLADLALEVEAATAFAIRVAGAVDRARTEPQQAALARVATAIGKFWICRRAVAVVNEAQECLGGNGYVEESLLPRLYRQAPLNSIWEGSGNIQCLDVLRALQREPETGRALWMELSAAAGRNVACDAAVERLHPVLHGSEAVDQSQARRFVVSLALALQASVLLRAASPVAEAFCDTRLSGGHGYGMAAGALTASAGLDVPIERSLPMQ